MFFVLSTKVKKYFFSLVLFSIFYKLENSILKTSNFALQRPLGALKKGRDEFYHPIFYFIFEKGDFFAGFGRGCRVDPPHF